MEDPYRVTKNNAGKSRHYLNEDKAKQSDSLYSLHQFTFLSLHFNHHGHLTQRVG